jgi:hypothetical protein
MTTGSSSNGGKPVRVQLSRRKNWEMPDNTVRVTRPGPFGNPFIVSPKARPGARSGVEYMCVPSVEDAVSCFRDMVNLSPTWREAVKRELRGKNLACWCKLDDPCHADVLLEIANE